MRASRWSRLVYTALFTALTTVATLVIQVPSPMSGYVNLGDAMVLLSAWILGPVYGTAAAGIGSMLADLLSGYAYYAPGTLIIKCLMAFVAAQVFLALQDKTKGKRFALPNAEIMIHQPLIGGQGGGLSGQTTDIKIHAEHMVYIRDKMNRMLSEYTGQPLEKIQQDTERDNYLTAQQAKEYGLIDEVIAHR